MKQKIVSRSVDLFLKKDSDFREESTVKLIENIKNKSHWTDPNTGETVDVKDMSLGEMMEKNLKRVGQSGWHNFNDVFDRKFSNEKYNADGHIERTLDEAYGKGQNDFGNVFGDKIRSVSVGDVFSVQEWGEDGVQVGNVRTFLVSDVGFDEFKFATGEFL